MNHSLIPVVIVAPYFAPSNMTCGLRSRLFASHLREFGYEPIILSVDPKFYEQAVEPELTRLCPDDLRVIRTPALPTRPMRLVGDIGVRSFYFHYQKLCEMAEKGEFQLLYIPMPPNYSSLLGPLIKRRFGIPYAIDYIDPWIYPITESEKSSWKARASHWMARRLEPFVLNGVDGISGVAESYFADVMKRHPGLTDIPTIGLPYGADPADHEYVVKTNRAPKILHDAGLAGKRVLTYAGAFLPRSGEVLRSLFQAARRLEENGASPLGNMHFLFVGTDSQGQIANLAAEAGVTERVTEISERQPYLDVLALLHHSHAAMVIGSTEPHYTASKIFQALLSKRPVLAALHDQSTACLILREFAGTELATFSDSLTELPSRLSHCLHRVLTSYSERPILDGRESLKKYHAREITDQLASFFDQILRTEENENRHYRGSRDTRAAAALRRY